MKDMQLNNQVNVYEVKPAMTSESVTSTTQPHLPICSIYSLQAATRLWRL